MALGAWGTETLNTKIRNYVREFLTVTPSLYKFFEANGLIRNVGEGVDKEKYFDEKEPDGLQMASSIHDANVITPQFGEVTVGLLYLAGDIVISMQDVDKFKNNQWIGGSLIQRTINSAMRVALRQVNQFLAWGDEMKNPVKAIDPIRGKGEFTGIFNGGTEITGGTANDMQTAGDYLKTVGNMRKALLTAGHEMPKYMILSDLDTELYSTLENKFYSTVGITEYRRVMELPYIKDWMVSPDFIDYSQVKYRMAMIAPKQRINTKNGPGGVVPTMELIQGYPFVVRPELSGGTLNGYYRYKLIWSGRLIEYWATANQRTPTLTLT